ncbi:MAG: PAS domain S-box protein, partial [Chloroflexi bacterium]|nr:PAS domain S-box protein [Chloroflexota bacterium]
DRKVILINKKGCEILGYDEQEIVGRSWFDFLPQDEKDRVGGTFDQLMAGEIERMEYFENPILTKSGQERLIAWHNSMLTDEAGRIIGVVSSGEDITERKRAEEALRNREGMLQKIFDILPVGLWIADQDGKLLRGNPAGVKIWGAEPRVALSEIGVFKARRLPSGEEVAPDDWALAHTIRDRVTIVDELLEIDAFDGKKKTILNYTAPVLDARGDVQGAIVVNQDITERKQAEDRIRRQLEHLTALSVIDRVIAAIFDLRLSLSEIINLTTKELGVDAADILILNSNSSTLEYGAERGFRATAVRKTQVRLSESYAGRAVLERHLIQIPNLRNEPNNLFMTTLLTDEDFVCYYGVPLIIKGQVKGVLEVYHRASLEPDAEWFGFLNALAGRVAIAIENVTLFENLQRSNSELIMAYDATIEGWSQAMDLRDKETEGHTQRVTEMTVKLAGVFGLSEAEQVQVRWGALLHDIGKMGVPDGILLKPGPLTDEEWVAMKKHPTFAHEMLAPIRYLRLALDIPYCHHEKWDGTGYPRGLKGTQIPLAARIFAVVDVWDALRSDRPYRAAWTEEKVREHIHISSGTHFDPQVVDVFMQNPNLM